MSNLAVEDERKVVYKVVVPGVYRKEVMNLAHDLPIA
jgi:hypothetical protein